MKTSINALTFIKQYQTIKTSKYRTGFYDSIEEILL